MLVSFGCFPSAWGKGFFVLNFLYFVSYSFAGWAFETAACSVVEKRFVKRGFLNVPCRPICGRGAMLMLTSQAMEKASCARLVSSVAAKIPSFMANIAGGVLAADYIATIAGLSSLNDRPREFSEMMKDDLKEARATGKEKLKRFLPHRREGGSEEISAACKAFLKKMGFQQRRTFSSFPRFRSIKYAQAAEKLRALLLS